MKRNRQNWIDLMEEQWTCPITSMPMNDPVITSDGHSYQKNQIITWLSKQKKSPKTGLQLPSITVIPNITLKNVIQKFKNEAKYQFQRLCNENKELLDQIKQLELRVKEQQQEIQSLEIQNQQYKNHISLNASLNGALVSDNNIQQNHPILRMKEQEMEKVQKIPEQPRNIRHILPFEDYLMSYPVLYNEKKKTLDHSEFKIDMDYFLMHNWSDLSHLNLNTSQIDDIGFQMLANEIQYFTNLQGLGLCTYYFNEREQLDYQYIELIFGEVEEYQSYSFLSWRKIYKQSQLRKQSFIERLSKEISVSQNLILEKQSLSERDEIENETTQRQIYSITAQSLIQNF